MAVFQQTHQKISVLISVNAFFCFLLLILISSAIAEDRQSFEAEKTSIRNLALEGKTDEALIEYESLVMTTGKEDLTLLRDLSSGILKRNWRKSISILGDLEDGTAVQFFVSFLQNGEDPTAEAAAEALRKLGDERAIPPLIEVALCHANSNVRKAALNALDFFNNNDQITNNHVTALMRSLQSCMDMDDTPLSFAVKKLGEMGDKRAAPVLLELFDQMIAPYPRERIDLTPEEIARSLSKLGDNSAEDKLRDLIRKGNEKQRIKAAYALGDLGDKSVIPILIKILKDKSESAQVRASAVAALSSLGDKMAVPVLTEALNDKSGLVREQSAVALYELGYEDVLPTIIDEMKANHSIPESVIKSFTLDANAVPFLINVLCQEDLSSRQYIRAANLLSEIRDRRAVPILLQLLKDYKSRRRHSREIVAIALGNIGDKRAVPALMDALKDRDDMDMVRAAIEALYKLGDKQAIWALIEELDDDEGFYLRENETIRINEGIHFIFSKEKDINRGAAAMVLGKFGDLNAVPVLIKCLRIRNYYNNGSRLKIAEALGELGDKRAVPALIEAMEENDPWLSKEAAKALAKLGEKSAIPVLIESFTLNIDDYDRMMMVQCISKFGHSPVPVLIQALDSTDTLKRTWAARTIGEIYSKIMIRPTEEMVKDTPFGEAKEPDQSTETKGLKGKSGRELWALLRSNNPVSLEDPTSLKALGDNSGISDVRMAAISGKNISIPSGTINKTLNEEGKGALSNLRNRLKDENPEMEYEAALDLKKMGVDPGAPVSEETLNGLIPKAKDYNAELIGSEAGLRKALRALRKKLNDPFDKVQVASAEALWKIVDHAEVDSQREQQMHAINLSSKYVLLQ